MNFKLGNYKFVYWLNLFLLFSFHSVGQKGINRYDVVSRHNININAFDSLNSLTVGNGHFAYTIDATGMQSFPDYYARGIPLGTQSEWGWHSFPNDSNYIFEETLKEYTFNGMQVKYSVQGHEKGRNNNAVDYFRSNPHRLHLANIGLEIMKHDDTKAEIIDFKNIQQKLDLWKGIITSKYTIDQNPIEVITIADPTFDAISYKIKSPLLLHHQIKIRIRIPSPTGEWKEVGNQFEKKPNQHSILSTTDHGALIKCTVDTTQYFIKIQWKGRARMVEYSPSYFLVEPDTTNQFELTVGFQSDYSKTILPTFANTLSASQSHWKRFWLSGAAVDFSSCTDPNAMELERRIILSQYLTRIQCVSSTPPQETGLTYNSWYGRPHMEMHWWHAVHFALWGRPELLSQCLGWYKRNYEQAKILAQRQGFQGIRWPKMTDPQGHETPSSVGAFLIWQQPHLIYLCELMFRSFHLAPKSSSVFIQQYKKLIFSTADFMVDYLHYDSLSQRYDLGPGMIPAQERFGHDSTVNPAFEVSYWRWALNLAQQWRVRSGLPRDAHWDQVIQHLPSLAIKDSLYLACASASDSYSNPRYMADHPMVLGSVAGIPVTKFIDTTIMKKTFIYIWNHWDWSTTWGWDYPMMAMAATRLNMPDYAIRSLLMLAQKNTYLINGHNYQDQRLTIYLPGNGGLLAAIAMMCKGSDHQNKLLSGFPNDGKWNVKMEGFNKIF